MHISRLRAGLAKLISIENSTRKAAIIAATKTIRYEKL